MKTAVDTSVLLDVLAGAPPYAEASQRALRAAYSEGALIACDVVWAETRAHFPDPKDFEKAVALIQLEYQPLNREASELAGQLWSRYRKKGGTRERVMADFLIGAHALLQADRLLARDRGFYRPYFDQLKVIDPSH